MNEIKEKIGRIDAFGRELAATVNERVEEEGLVGQSPATMRRVEELIDEVCTARDAVVGFNPGSGAEPMGDEEDEDEFLASDFEFRVIGKGITAKPFVAPSRYIGTVGE